MQTRSISEDDAIDFVERMLVDYPVFAPMEFEAGFFRFDRVEDVRDVVWQYTTTTLPPKKVIFPQHDTLFRFSQENGKPTFEPVVDKTPRVILGVHPCDLAGIAMLDWAFSRDPVDEHYQARRNATILIGIDCHPDEHCFCTQVGTDAPEGHFDLFLTPIKNGFLVTVGTDTGQHFLETYAETREATPENMAEAGQYQKAKKSEITPQFQTDIFNLPLTFQHGVNSPVWSGMAKSCLSCGTCNLVCPTCFCFDVEDHMDIDGKGGVRQRTWDACHLTEFARVAGGHNFRAESNERLRHRFYRKYQYLMTLYGTPFCTGCGRCGRSCPVDINVVDTVNALVNDGQREGSSHGG